MELNNIYQSVQGDLDRVKDEIRSIARIDFAWLSEQLSHVVQNTGKGIRPALTLLCGTFYEYDFKYLMPMAVSVELMHTATLVHDDAIDKAEVRRGQPTINSMYGEDPAILLGDYLFAKAGEYVADTHTPRVIKLFSQTLATISSGELNQYINAYKTEQTREQYIQRISWKTASLFSLATESGSILSKAPEEASQCLKNYGHNLGIAFQIVDDVLDFVSDIDTLGKPVGSDLEQGTLTLPAMMLLERYPDDNPVNAVFKQRDASALQKAIDMVRNSSIIEECYAVAQQYSCDARNCLSVLPQNGSASVLRELADFVVDRKV